MLPLNHQVSNLFLAPQDFACIFDLKCIHVHDSHTNLIHLSHGNVYKENLSCGKYHNVAMIFQYRDGNNILL